MRILSACLIAIFLVFAIPSSALAHTVYDFPQSSEGQVNEALANVVPVRFLISSPFYLLISVKETVNRFFQPSAVKKAEFDMVVSGKKLKETYLLVEKGDVKNASRTLVLYSDRLDKMSKQIEKARSQNQDVTALVDLIAENLRVHETLFFAINKKWEMMEEGYSFDENFAGAIAAHGRTVMVLNNVKPGVKDRFTTVEDEATEEAEPSPSPLGESTFEASPAVRPKKIIY